MAREINRLSARRVQTIKEPGRHADGGGLYLVVDEGGSKRWVMLYRLDGKRREMGLGSVLGVPLVQARDLAAAARQQIAGGVDPIKARQRTPPVEIAPAVVVTFGMVAETYMTDHETTWRSKTHRAQWRQTLEVQAASLWTMPVRDIGTAEVLAVLRPMWQTKAETARRLRGRIERVLDAARAAGHVVGPNPAAWRGHLDAVLPKAKRLARGHHVALPYAEARAFMATLRDRPAPAARMLEFVILTASRSGEVRAMRWAEIDFGGALWTVPAERMKAKRVHRVPLSATAIAILAARQPSDPDPSSLVFPNTIGGVYSDMVFKALLVRMGFKTITTHGFRSTFRDWAADETDHAREVIEAALAHLVGDETERAYRRGDALAKRRALMDHWAAFLDAPGPESGAESTKA